MTIRMKKLGNKNFGFASYDPKCPFDMGQQIVDEVEHRGASMNWTRELLTWELHDHYFTPFGKEVIKAFDIISLKGGVAVNTGIGQANVDFFIRYYNWANNNCLDMEWANDVLGRMRTNNPDLDFSKIKTTQQIDMKEDK